MCESWRRAAISSREFNDRILTGSVVSCCVSYTSNGATCKHVLMCLLSLLENSAFSQVQFDLF